MGLAKQWSTSDDLAAPQIKAHGPPEIQSESALHQREYARQVEHAPKAAETPCRSVRTFPTQSTELPVLITSCKFLTHRLRTALVTAPSHPPVTVATLAQLDLHCIFHNIHVRSDINFETDLHFLPVKGCIADERRREAKAYWLALVAELQVHLHTLGDGCGKDVGRRDDGSARFAPRLPQMFASLGELLLVLMPASEHDEIVDKLDVSFLMQQIENGVLDIVGLTKWLAALLKRHCAPMRDQWADQAVTQVEQASSQSDINMLVGGIGKLFGVLEAMRLDVANHQIRTFRYTLLEDTISFQQNFFQQKLADGSIDGKSCRNWYRAALDHYRSSILPTAGMRKEEKPYGALIHGVMAGLVAGSHRTALPPSFWLEFKRLERIKRDIRDLVHLQMALALFREVRSWLPSQAPSQMSCEDDSALCARLVAIVDEQSVGMGKNPWLACSAEVSLEISRAACAHSQLPASSMSDELISGSHSRLREMSVARPVEKQLLWKGVLAKVAGSAIEHADVFDGMSPVAMSESQLLSRQSVGTTSPGHALPEVEDIARRLSHVMVLHWRTWAPLVYLDYAG